MRALLTLMALSLAVLPAPGIARTPAERLVVPGERIGPWTLQMTVEDIVALLGRQTRIASGGQLGSDLQTDLRVYRWDRVGLLVYTRDDRSILLMEINEAPEFATDKGIAFDAGRGAVESAYGEPTRISQFGASPNNLSFQYDRMGLEVYFSGAARVQGLGVFRPGTAASIWKH